VHGELVGIYTQGGSTGVVRALMDAGHPFIPVSGEGENGFRKLCAEHAEEGLLCASAGQTPALVAVAIKTAISALQGNVMPQYISVPIPYVEHPGFEDNVNFYSDLSDNFFVANSFPECGVNFDATDIMAESEVDN
jgi:ribose transport system substrate-binding protein